MSERPRYPIGGRMSDVVLGLARRFRLPGLMARHSSVVVLGAFAFVNGCISIGLMAIAALATGQPFVFPSLGPTAFLLFYTPDAASASPRNTIAGHLIGAAAGYLSLAVFGLLDAGPALSVGVSGTRVGAAALSLGLTAGLMAWLKVPHPPAGATTLIVSLGLLTRPVQLGVLMLAVVLLVLQGFVINRAAGIDYPPWGPRPRGNATRGTSGRTVESSDPPPRASRG
jgi:CBS domain-containing membrane protein